MKEAIFEQKFPTFEEVLYWRKRESEIDFVIDHFHRACNKCFEDPDAFLQSYDFDRCLRALYLIMYFHNNEKALPLFEKVLRLNILMYQNREDQLYFETERFLERWASSEHESLLLSHWEKFFREPYYGEEQEDYGFFPYVDFISSLLLKIGCKEKHILRHSHYVDMDNNSTRSFVYKNYYDTDVDQDFELGDIIFKLVDLKEEKIDLSEYGYLCLV